MKELTGKFEVRFNSLYICSPNDPFVDWALKLKGTTRFAPREEIGALKVLFDRSHRKDLTTLYERVKKSIVGSETRIRDEVLVPPLPIFDEYRHDPIASIISSSEHEPLKTNRCFDMLPRNERPFNLPDFRHFKYSKKH